PAVPQPVPPTVGRVLQSGGAALDPGVRRLMESRFGHDFSGVRVHTDAEAAVSAREVGATAYTMGHDLVFATGRYSPRSVEERRRQLAVLEKKAAEPVSLPAEEVAALQQQRAALQQRLAAAVRASVRRAGGGAATSSPAGTAASSPAGPAASPAIGETPTPES